jgi:hypothetical protein
MRVAGFEILAIYGVGRKVLIAFHNNSVIAFGQHGSVPNCLWHCDHSLSYEKTNVATAYF